MRGKTTITINGRLYDAVTGLPVSAVKAETIVQSNKKVSRPTGAVMSDVGPRRVQKTPSKPIQHAARKPQSVAQSIHKAPQKSQTLHRSALKRPTSSATVQSPKVQPQRSDMIKKFAPAGTATNSAPVTVTAETHSREQLHHVVTKTHQQHHAKKMAKAAENKPAQLHGKELKEHLIKEQMRHVDTIGNLDKKPGTIERLRNKYPRSATIATGIASLVLLGGYLTYINLPSLSIRVAAAQAGVNASFPTYQPSGYSFNGPVAFSPGEVRVAFKSNTNDYNYSLVQRDSSWDSQAVLDNYVLKETKQYATLQERGLTIYLMNNKAAWVNGGVLYTIEGNAPLSGEQIQKIASSTI